jgi:hypothetical protein
MSFCLYVAFFERPIVEYRRCIHLRAGTSLSACGTAFSEFNKLNMAGDERIKTGFIYGDKKTMS